MHAFIICPNKKKDSSIVNIMILWGQMKIHVVMHCFSEPTTITFPCPCRLSQDCDKGMTYRLKKANCT